MPVRLPTPGGDSGDWGSILNNFLSVALNSSTGGLNDNVVTTSTITDSAITTGKINDLAITSGKIANNAVTAAKVAADVATQSELDAVSQQIAVNAQGGDYTLQASDAGKKVRINSSSAQTVTVPPSVFSDGAVVQIFRAGTGAVAIAAGSGVTINATALGIAAQYTGATLHQISTNTWDLEGNLA